MVMDFLFPPLEGVPFFADETFPSIAISASSGSLSGGDAAVVAASDFEDGDTGATATSGSTSIFVPDMVVEFAQCVCQM